MVGKLGKSIGTLATTLAVACATMSAVPVSVAAQEGLSTGEYGMDDYGRGFDATSTGETKLYLMKDQYAGVGNEGARANHVQLNVTIPVGIHYTVLENDRIVGPADQKVFFRNETQTSAVHVSGIFVQEANGAHIVTKDKVKDNTADQAHDTLALSMRPDPGHYDDKGNIVMGNPGHDDEFGAYVGNTPKSPAHKHDWDIAPGEVLALNKLGGSCFHDVIFDALNPAVETQIGSVRWSVRLGTRAQADANDSCVTLRFHANGGTVVSGQPLQDMAIPVIDADALPEVVAIDDVLNTQMRDATGELTRREVIGSEVIDRIFIGWAKDAAGLESVETLEDLVDVMGVDSVADLAGKTVTLYADYA
jgi:hypothetical protein